MVKITPHKEMFISRGRKAKAPKGLEIPVYGRALADEIASDIVKRLKKDVQSAYINEALYFVCKRFKEKYDLFLKQNKRLYERK